MTDAQSPGADPEIAAYARSQGLTKVGQRPGPWEYAKSLWKARAFIWTMSSSRSYGQYQNNYLGQLWTILSPLTLAGVYYVVFGMLLDTTRGTSNFTAFLVIGIFIFLSIASTLASGANSILNNMQLVRSLQFPRAVLPISVSIAEMLNLLPAIAVMYVIVALSGEPLTWSWLLLPVVLLLILIFTAGACMIAARIVVAARDLRNLIPMVTRVLRYGSGVFFSIQALPVSGLPAILLEYQPVALYLNLARSCLMEGISASPEQWLVGAGWAVVFFIIGFFVFWSAEDQYGRE